MRSPPLALVTSGANAACIASLASLRAAGYETVYTRAGGTRWGLRSRNSHACFALSADSFSAFERDLLDLVRRLRPEVLLPLGTPATRVSVRNFTCLEELTTLLVPPAHAFHAAFDKGRCLTLCRRLGIPCPEVFSEEAARESLEAGDGPLVVKPPIDVGAAESVRYVTRKDELDRALSRCRERFGGALIQEFIHGPATSMHMVVLLFSRHGELHCSFTSQKIRQWPPAGGFAIASRSTGREDLVREVLPLFEAVGWRGPAEVELKVDSRDGVTKLIEVNPRFPTYLGLARHCGLDLPHLAVRLARTREPLARLPFPAYRVGLDYAVPGLFIRHVLEEMRQRRSLSVLVSAARDFRRSLWTLPALLADPAPALDRALRPSPDLAALSDGAGLPGDGGRE